MRYLLPVLLLASLGMAIQFGPAGMPLDWRNLNIEWMESSKFTSPSATSYLSMAGDTLFITRTGATGIYDQVLCFVDESGNKNCVLYWRDKYSQIVVPSASGGDFLVGVPGTTAQRIVVGNEIYFDSDNGSGVSYLQLTDNDLVVDPDFGGSGTLQLGETGDADITYLNGRLQTNITTVAVATTMGASDGYMYTMTANDTLRCPTTPLAGEVLMCKFTNAAGGWIKGMGNTIDGASEVAASENDNIMIVWNATASEWEVR